MLGFCHHLNEEGKMISKILKLFLESPEAQSAMQFVPWSPMQAHMIASHLLNTTCLYRVGY